MPHDNPSGALGAFPPDFQYSQRNMHDFRECARRFQLRHLLRQEWPAPLLEPIAEAEAEAKRGERFHRLLERHFLGLPTLPPANPELAGWWAAFQGAEKALNLPTAIRKPEVTYSIPVAGQRLMARFDLVAIDPGKSIVIVDWKTGRRPSNPDLLRKRMQTFVYLAVGQRALETEFGGPIPPEAIRLMYWFVATPADPVTIHLPDPVEFYGYVAFVEKFVRLIQISAEGNNWPLTDDLRRCSVCNYRSYCNRAVDAATVDEADASEMFLWDAESIQEVEL
jgi:RecB family exonuclease